MKKLEVGFWGLHHCDMLKRYCDSALTHSHRSAKKLRAGSELKASWKALQRAEALKRAEQAA